MIPNRKHHSARVYPERDRRNAENRLIKVDGGSTASYDYDALGRMVEQNRSGAYTQLLYSPTGMVVETGLTPNGQYQQLRVPLPGGAMAIWSGPGGSIFFYRHADWLGSSRLGSTPSRTTYFDVAYAPFGETYASSGSADPAFTSQRQDTVSGLYDFPAREYSIQGRWPSPDPAGLAAVDPMNPQSWNRYAYALNDPTDLVDPSGLGSCGDFISCVIDSGGPSGNGGDIFFFGVGSFGHPCPHLYDGGCYIGSPNGGDDNGTGRSHGNSSGPTMGPTPAPRPPTIGPTTDWSDSKQAMCVAQAVKAVGKDLIFSDVFSAVSDSIATGSLSPLKDLLSAGTAVTAVEQTADYVAGQRVIQAATRGFLRSQGFRVSASAIGRDASLLGKWAGVVGLALSTKTGYDAYNACMSN